MSSSAKNVINELDIAIISASMLMLVYLSLALLKLKKTLVMKPWLLCYCFVMLSEAILKSIELLTGLSDPKKPVSDWFGIVRDGLSILGIALVLYICFKRFRIMSVWFFSRRINYILILSISLWFFVFVLVLFVVVTAKHGTNAPEWADNIRSGFSVYGFIWDVFNFFGFLKVVRGSGTFSKFEIIVFGVVAGLLTLADIAYIVVKLMQIIADYTGTIGKIFHRLVAGYTGAIGEIFYRLGLSLQIVFMYTVKELSSSRTNTSRLIESEVS